MSRAVVTLSGGMDSATALAEALDADYECFPVAFDYGQRQLEELRCAKKLVARYQQRGAAVNDLRVVTLGGMELGSALTGAKPLPVGRTTNEVLDESIGVTYVPCRNSIFLSIAAALAEALEADGVWTGFNCNDARGFPVPDGRLEFVRAMELAIMLGSKRGALEGNPIEIVSPLLELDKAGVIRRAIELGVPLGLTRSCFAGGVKPCGECDACVVRRDAFEQVGIGDPALVCGRLLR